MSSRPLIAPKHLVVDQSMAASFNSAPTITQMLSMISYDISWSGTSPVGTISVECSNTFKLDPAGGTLVTGNWTTMTLDYNGSSVTSIPVTGNTGNIFIDIDETAAYAIRIVYTKTSGTGTMNATVAAKVA